MHIWLAYVSYPVTTAVYFERALKNDHKFTTCGPSISQELIKAWKLENMNLPVIPHDIPLDAEPDILEVFNKAEDKPELFFWIESVYGFFPRNIDKLPIPKICYLIDSHLNLQWHLEWAKNFDHVFIAQKEYLDDFRKAGNKNVHWLPLGCDAEIHSGEKRLKKYDIGFVGSMINNPRRTALIDLLSEKFSVFNKRCFWKEMSQVFTDSKIIFNNSIRNDLNMRLFEVMSTGTFLLTDNALNSGQEVMFVDGEDLAVYSDKYISGKAEFYLENDELREAIASRGNEIIHNAHTYKHRTDEIFKILNKKTKETPSPEEWRKRSINNIEISSQQVNKLKRSFVIPVLDYSPASNLNIKTLLADFENIEGNVIIVFNSEKVAEEMKNHPRIDCYAVMNKNVGVARAWNIGLNISQTPVTFICNADLHITKEAVEKIENGLIELPDAAMAGPQGSMFNFEQAKDLIYYDKGVFDAPAVVDAVSGFFFAVKTKYFNSGILKFENSFTPCYFEEWDIGLQIKKAGLKSYIIPVTEYEHHWSGSIRAYREIEYYNKKETAGQILERNKKLFFKKWNDYGEKNGKDILISEWKKLAFEKGEQLIESNNLDIAFKLFAEINMLYPGDKAVLTNLGVISFLKDNIKEAKEYFHNALEIDPFFEPASDNLKIIEDRKCLSLNLIK